jgi:hypothetical protein
MTKAKSIFSRDANGEFIYNGLNSHISKKYRADTPLDKSFVPYLIMLFCAVVDATVFINLFKLISYDSPVMLGVEVAGFLFAFDAVPLYLGIQLRRLKQGISKDRFIVWIAIGVCVLACILNIFLRISTIDLMSPDSASTSTSFFGTVVEQTASTETDPTAIALTVFGICLPVLTSCGSFFISYLTYNPLIVKKRAAEEMLAEKTDEIRRIDAYIGEYEANIDFAEHLQEDDEEKYHEMQKYQKALVLSYCDYVRQRLKEKISNPTSTNALSEETCVAILDRLDKELAALDSLEQGKTGWHSESEGHTYISDNTAA